ncbi:MAG: hypothetical protein DLM53_08570 [Candidatus Eremiobacter antarcticus]|nr:ABC transporter substrate-binding protein [Candidatus Eremiobacteraeota bacterium]MBC5809118.1 ABC transporter substrate-binding protein [Candidatus Eremiobacteraeota bacterium]PZR61628.1 MAG: hypothetical protein DLM53_08570 [Candidatus Eremiobacter sp. RRmetagenome_bin22]
MMAVRRLRTKRAPRARSVAVGVCLLALTACVVCRLPALAKRLEPSARIVSLAPSLTEIAFAIGCGPQLVADTIYDDYPEQARRLPHVADLVQADLEAIAALHPTVVLALHDQEQEAEPIRARLQIGVEYLPNRRLDDLFIDIDRVGRACSRTDAAHALAQSLRVKLRAVAARTSHTQHRPRVFFLLDLPGFTAGRGSFIGDLISLAGGVNVAGGIAQPYPNVTAEWLLQADPDIIIVSRATPFGPDVRNSAPWKSTHAVQQGRVFRPPSDDVLQRNGPRIVSGLAWLASAFRSR